MDNISKVLLVCLLTVLVVSMFYSVKEIEKVRIENDDFRRAMLYMQNKQNEKISYLVSKLSDKDWCRFQKEVVGEEYPDITDKGKTEIGYQVIFTNPILRYMNSESSGVGECRKWLEKTDEIKSEYKIK